MKVLHLVDHFNLNCGMSNSTKEMIKSTTSKGVLNFMYSGEGSGIDQLREIDCKLYIDSKFTKKFSLWNILRISIFIYHVVKAEQINVLHAHHRLLGFVAFLISKITSARVVHSDHNVLYGKRTLSYLGGPVISDSEFNAKHCVKYFRKNRKDVLVIPAFINLNRLSKKKINSDEGKFVAVGRLENQKNFGELIKAVHIVHSQGIRISLSIYGSGSQQDYLENLIDVFGLQKSIEINQPVRNVSKAFEKSECMIISSLHEGTCIVGVEAAYCRIPILTTRVGGIPDYLPDNKTTIFFNSTKAEDIASGILHYLKMSIKEKLQLVNSAEHSVKGIFDTESQANKLKRVYDSV